MNWALVQDKWNELGNTNLTSTFLVVSKSNMQHKGMNRYFGNKLQAEMHSK